MTNALNCDFIEFVLPSEPDRETVYLVEVSVDTFRQFFFGRNTNSSEKTPGHLTEEYLDEVQPRTVFWGKHKLESVRFFLQPFHGGL